MTNLSHALTGCDAVVHLAACAHVMYDEASDSLEAYRRANTIGTINFAHQAAAAGVKRFIFIISVKVIGEQISTDNRFAEDYEPAQQDAYGISKYEAEFGLKRLAEETTCS